MRIATTLALFVAAEAKKCRTKCDDPFTLNKDACKCECASECESYQTQNGDTCACEDKPCETACAPGEGGTATAADFAQSAQPSCECSPADGKDPCDAIYGGLWTTQADGTACPAGGDAGEGGEGEGGEGEGEGSGASQLIAGAMVLAASLLI